MPRAFWISASARPPHSIVAVVAIGDLFVRIRTACRDPATFCSFNRRET
jgi:hypothetical protein